MNVDDLYHNRDKINKAVRPPSPPPPPSPITCTLAGAGGNRPAERRLGYSRQELRVSGRCATLHVRNITSSPHDFAPRTLSSTPRWATQCTRSRGPRGRSARASSRARANDRPCRTSAKAGPAPFPQPNFPYIYRQASARRTSTRARALVSKPSTSQRACKTGPRTNAVVGSHVCLTSCSHVSTICHRGAGAGQPFSRITRSAFARTHTHAPTRAPTRPHTRTKTCNRTFDLPSGGSHCRYGQGPQRRRHVPTLTATPKFTTAFP